jgi:hypothetical protein
MRAYRKNFLVAVAPALVLVLAGCGSDSSGDTPSDETTVTQPTSDGSGVDSGADAGTDADAGAGDDAGADGITIPAGAYAASDEFPFPVPEGWQVLDEFVAGTLGKDVTMDGSVEYPGDAKEAAATYLSLLKAAGFDAYTYAPGEVTNQASLAADGVINGTLYLAILNFDVHADGYQRVSITAAERD